MKTFISWIIANITSIMNVIYIAVFELALFCGIIPIPETSSLGQMALLGPLLICLGCGFIGGIPAKNVTTDIINIVLLAVFYICLFALTEESDLTNIIIIGIVLSLFMAAMATVFTARNFDLVVSRRMLYRNSSTDMFEYKLKYSINRFVAVLSACSSLLLVVSIFASFA